jgi:hypothetical protein
MTRKHVHGDETAADQLGVDLGGRLDAPPPPPRADLLARIAGMQAVRTRGRFAALAAVLAAGIVVPVAMLAVMPWRRDLAALPRAWVIGAAAVWFAAFATPLVVALVPARGDVLPSAGRASRVALAAVGALAAFTLLGSSDAPGVSPRLPPGAGPLLISCLRCISVLLPVALVFLIAGIVVLRRLLPMGARRIGVALGAAGGAMGGFVLHWHCPLAQTAHVVLGHVGGVVLAAAAGAILLPALLERGR